MNDLFATWHNSHPGVLEQLSQARRRLAGEPGLEAAWVMVDNAIAQVSLWLEQQNGAAPAARSGVGDAQRLLHPVPQHRLGDGAETDRADETEQRSCSGRPLSGAEQPNLGGASPQHAWLRRNAAT